MIVPLFFRLEDDCTILNTLEWHMQYLFRGSLIPSVWVQELVLPEGLLPKKFASWNINDNSNELSLYIPKLVQWFDPRITSVNAKVSKHSIQLQCSIDDMHFQTTII